MKKLFFVLITIGLFACTRQEIVKPTIEKGEVAIPCFHCIDLQMKKVLSCANCEENLPDEALQYKADSWSLDPNYGLVDTVIYEDLKKVCFLKKSHLRASWMNIFGSIWYCLEIEEDWNWDGYPLDSPEYMELLEDCVVR